MSNDFTFKNTIPVAPLKLCALEREYVVYPGHGQSTSLGFEVQNNPYLGDERWSI